MWRRKKKRQADKNRKRRSFLSLVCFLLLSVRRWKEVSCVSSPELQLVLLEAREKDGAPVQSVLPLPVHRSLSHRRFVRRWRFSLILTPSGCSFSHVCKLCSVRRVLDRGFPTLLCAVASDSTLVYQRMTDGLVTPDPPAGPFQDVGRRQHRKRRQQR